MRRRRNRLFALVVLAVAGCGSERAPPPDPPTAADARDFLGLNPGSCWRYRLSSGLNVFATVTVTGPDQQMIDGHTVYVRSYHPPTTSLTNDYLLDVDATAGEIRLARSVEGSANRVTRTYLTEPRPLWAKLVKDAGGEVSLAETSFTTSATPREDPGAIEHKWVLLNAAEAVTTPAGPATALKLSYTRSVGGTELYWLVPGYGFTQFTDASNIDHQVCASRVCGSDGACTGEASCDDLVARCSQ